MWENNANGVLIFAAADMYIPPSPSLHILNGNSCAMLCTYLHTTLYTYTLHSIPAHNFHQQCLPFCSEGCPDLDHMGLSCCKVTGAGLLSLTNGCRQLRSLDLSYCANVGGAYSYYMSLPQTFPSSSSPVLFPRLPPPPLPLPQTVPSSSPVYPFYLCISLPHAFPRR